MKKNLITLLMVISLCLFINGCGALIVGGAGAAAGYIAHDEGYRVQSPVTKKPQPSEDSQKQ